jgi:hypothetical protein
VAQVICEDSASDLSVGHLFLTEVNPGKKSGLDAATVGAPLNSRLYCD